MESNESIIFRSGLTMGGIMLLALFSMISSVFIAEASKGDAAAINLAGSLRMQSYRIATRLQTADDSDAHHAAEVAREIDQFEHRLDQLWQTGAIPATDGNPKAQMLRTIEATWRETLRPNLALSAVAAQPAVLNLQPVDAFVAQLDQFVKLLEKDTETKILLLRLIQGIALFLTLALIFIAMYELHSYVIVPLRDLVELARRARSGDLTVRVSHVGKDELGVLGHAFNLMATDLSTMYAHLEAQVEQQTQALRTSNRSLKLLYHTAKRLSESPLDDENYHALLAEIEKLTGMGSVTLCLIDPDTHQATRVLASQPHRAESLPFCNRPHCQSCLGDGATHPLDAGSELFSIPIRDQERRFGVLIVHQPGLETMAAWQLPLLEAVACHIASALQAAERAEYHRRVALLEERTAIARELHDSLAQSLSYLKIQVSRLQVLPVSAEAHAIVVELREGLNSAYRQLRELITTFRLKMEHPRLEDSLRETVREFGHRGQLQVELDHAGWNCPLNPNQQVHVMQIVREALHNVVKHAHASHVLVRLHGSDSGEAVVDIVDDGIGLPAESQRDNHFGLNIMRERAHHLGGSLSLHSQPGAGLRVRLSFVPTAGQHSAPTFEEMRHA